MLLYKKKVFLLILFLIVFLCLNGCRKSSHFQLAGTVERKILELSAPTSEVIIQIPIKEGQRVKAGDIIVELDKELVAAELLAQESALEAANALLSETIGEFKRQSNLQKARIASVRSLDIARRKRDEALALVNEKKARVLQAKRHLEDLSIKTHNTGIIDQLPFETGERVPAGGVVAILISDEKPWVRVWLPARAVSQIPLQTKAEITIEGIKKKLSGVIEHISREPEFTPHYALTERESAHLVYETQIVLENAPQTIRSGLPAQVYIKVPKNK